LTLLPLLLKWQDNAGQLTWQNAWWLVGFMVVLQLYAFLYDRSAKTYRAKTVRRRLLQRLSLELTGTISNFSKLVRPKQGQMQAIAATRKLLLDCIRRVAEIHLADYEGAHLEATLLLFADEDCKQMQIAQRTTTERPTGKIVNSDEIMAYYVARSGKHRAINDYLKDNHPFGKSGLSAANPPYRSILLIPLLELSSGAPDVCLGVVSIDSQRPYHFWPGSGDDLVVKVKPYCTWLAILLSMATVPRLPCTA
jgi:hypothetical protein